MLEILFAWGKCDDETRQLQKGAAGRTIIAAG
jgi:hypothetical protein